MKPRLTAAAWVLFPKPRGPRQARAYLAGARWVASWAWLDYRAQEWVIELEDLERP